MDRPNNLNAALNRIENPKSDDNRWTLLAIILRQLMLAQGVDLDCAITDENRSCNQKL